MADEEFDRLAVQRDAALIHALATRTVPPLDVDLHDPVVTCLATWVDWVDAGVSEAEVFELAAHKDRVVASRGKRNRAALIAGSTVAALVVTSGAAAAVTGDPFIVAKAPFTVIEKINPFDTDGESTHRLPDKASEVAKVNALLAEAQRAMARGDTAEAERLMAEATAALGDNANPGQQNRIDKLVEDIDTGGQNPGSGGSDPSGGNGSQPDPGEPGTGKPDNGKPDSGKPDNDPGPADKDPVDKDPNSDKGQDKDPVDKDPVEDPQGGSSNGSKTEPGDDGGQGSGKNEDDSRGPKDSKGAGKSGRNDSGDGGSGDGKPDKDKQVKD